jgi:hypothetical protein
VCQRSKAARPISEVRNPKSDGRLKAESRGRIPGFALSPCLAVFISSLPSAKRTAVNRGLRNDFFCKLGEFTLRAGWGIPC